VTTSLVKSILLIRYSALGDVVLATGLVAPLRAKYPGVRVEWLTDAAYAPLLEGVVERVVPVVRRDPLSRAAALLDVRGRFDLAIDLQNKLWSIRVARAAAPERKRFVRRTAWEALKSLVGRDVIFDDVSASTLYARAAEVDAAGPLTLVVAAEARARAAALMPGGPWVALAPGAAWETKRWPAERYGAVGKALQARGFRVALLGGPMDEPLLAPMRAACTPDADFTKETLTVLAAALERSALLIGNDSGLVHVAQAVGSRALALFGPTSVRRWGPGPPSRALSLGLSCAPCTNHGSRACPLGHHDCLRKLDVERVLEECQALLPAPAA
jgi:heptosyltransferase-2